MGSGGFPIYISPQNQYLYFHSKFKWLVGPHFTKTLAGLRHSNCNEKCPNLCSNKWDYHVGNIRYRVESSINVSCDSGPDNQPNSSTIRVSALAPTENTTRNFTKQVLEQNGFDIDLNLIIGGSASGLVLFVLVTMSICFLRRKNKRLNEIKEAEKDNEDYDEINYDEINLQSNGNIHGSIAESIEIQTIQNPYYGGEIDSGPTAVKTVQNPYYGDGI